MVEQPVIPKAEDLFYCYLIHLSILKIAIDYPEIFTNKKRPSFDGLDL